MTIGKEILNYWCQKYFHRFSQTYRPVGLDKAAAKNAAHKYTKLHIFNCIDAYFRDANRIRTLKDILWDMGAGADVPVQKALADIIWHNNHKDDRFAKDLESYLEFYEDDPLIAQQFLSDMRAKQAAML